MNVLGTVRRVVGKIPLLGEEEDEIEDQNPYKRDLLKEIKIFNNQTAIADDKEKALVKIGHFSYTADPSCKDLIGGFVHKVVKVIGDTQEALSVRMQSVITLSEMCHFNKFIIDKLTLLVKQPPEMLFAEMKRSLWGDTVTKYYDPGKPTNIIVDTSQVWKSVRFSQIIPEILGDMERPHMSRWTCYLLCIMVAHSVAFLKELDRIGGFMHALKTCAAYDHDWRLFGEDLANKLLQLSGKPTVMQVKRDEEHKDLRSASKTGGSSSMGSFVDGAKSVIEMSGIKRVYSRLSKRSQVSPVQDRQCNTREAAEAETANC